MCFNQRSDISTLNGSSLKLMDKFTYPGSSVSSTETDINTRLAKTWTALDRLSVIWKSDLTDKMKQFFSSSGLVVWMQYMDANKTYGEKYDNNYTRMLRAILNKSWRQHPIKQLLYGQLPTITKIIKVRGNRHAGHCWRSRDELISDILLWNPSHGRAKAGRPARTYTQQLCADTRCRLEDLPEVIGRCWRSML